MTAEDKEQIELLAVRAKESAQILRYHGHVELSNNLLFNVGYAVGLISRLSKGEDEDPTPWCSDCGAQRRAQCHCPPRADND